MKALASLEPGGPETLRITELPDPLPRDDELVVAVAACGVNYPDVLVIEDRYQYRPQRPFAPGSEIAGTVLAVGAAVSGWRTGERMIGILPGAGGMAEKAAIKAKSAFHFPADLDLVRGSALLLTYATALHALKDRGRLGAGDTLLVLGAAGGVGLASIEVGKALGARVIAAVSSESKRAAALEAGADKAIIYPRGLLDKDASKELAAGFKKATGENGANVVLDPVGGDYAEPALRSIAWEGRYLVVGFPAGIPRLPLNLVLIKGCEVIGVFMGSFGERDPARQEANVKQLLEWWRDGRLDPKVTQTFALDHAGEAIAQMAARNAIGKLVVTVEG